MSGVDYYSTLDVNKSADSDAIKKAYRKMSMKYHPDRNRGDPDAEAKFKDINAAYEVLGDKEQRRMYDLNRSNPFMNVHQVDINPDDIINMMFGGGLGGGMEFHGPGHSKIFTNMGGNQSFPPFPFNRTTKPSPLLKTLEISIEDAYNGCKFPIKIERWVKYSHSSKVTEQETVYIEIPKGVDENEIFIIKDKGNVIAHEDLKGDVKVSIHIKNSSTFIRDGMDLIYKKNLTLKECLCGFSFELSHINGKVYNINNNKGSIVSNDQRKIIPELGMIRDETHGSLIIEFNVVFPEKLDESIINKLNEIL